MTVQPDTAPAGGFTRLDVRVPNERDDAGTTKVDVQLPPGIISASYEPVPGWKVKVTREEARRADRRRGLRGRRADLADHLDRRRQAGRIAPGQFQDFGLSLRMPEGKAGDEADLQGAADLRGRRGRPLDRAGGRRRARAGRDADGGGAGGGHGAPAAAPAAARRAAGARPRRGARDDGGSDTLSIVALVVGALGLVAALAALAAARRRSSTRREEVAA